MMLDDAVHTHSSPPHSSINRQEVKLVLILLQLVDPGLPLIPAGIVAAVFSAHASPASYDVILFATTTPTS